ncbi:MAG TPA: acyclic terpene utilization AtuA family protein [Spirochaetota bacterium]|nr:acyclic terpene utilization AtuA family protein [Spirochaetota bacterium]
MKEKNKQNREKVIIANCSGFFGDRLSAAKEMVQGGPIDYLTGDYLAELTMALLFRQKLKNPNGGYVPTFLKQVEEVLGECLDRGIRIISNAGGLNPRGLANELKALADKLGLKPKIACIEGDDILPRLAELQEKGESLAHLDKGISLWEAKGMPITANAYLGGWGIVEALNKGADIVIGGRIADAAVVSGPAAFHFGWKKTDWDRLAGAVAAGHIIECGAQATGGNYSFIDEIPSFLKMGYPIAEVFEDGSFVITKHPGTGGLVSVDTVKAQLLYEIREPAYLTPDVIAHFDTIDISQEAPDRVKITGVRGGPPTDTTKVCLNVMGGYRNSMTIILTGLDIEKKAKIFEDALFDSVGGRDAYETVEVQLIASQKENPETNETAFAYFKISVRDPDAEKVNRFSSKIVELGLANIPGFTATAPPAKGTPVIVHWPALLSVKHIEQKISVDGEESVVQAEIPKAAGYAAPEKNFAPLPAVPGGNTVKIPMGRLFATRSGDKGGNANLGVWAKNIKTYAFLKSFLTEDKLRELLKDLRGYEIERYELPNLLAVNFYIKGILGDGVAASSRSDPQAKTLGEYLRARIIEVPEAIVEKQSGE